MFKQIWRTKDIATILKEAEQGSGLKKVLTAWDLFLLGLGATIGTGIFVVTGIAAAQHAGPGVVLSFVIGGIACIFAGLSYAELASTVPISGSAYTYSYAVLGEGLAWLVGWNLILEYALSVSSVAAGWSGYAVGLVNSAFGIEVPAAISKCPSLGGVMDVPAFVIVMLITYLLVRGMKESAKANNILVYIKVAAVLLFLILASPHVSLENWTPFMPMGFSGVTAAAAIVFFAYLGFDAVSTSAEECRNPQRDLPLGLVGSLLACTLLYILVSGVLTGVVPYKELDNPEPVAYALRALGYKVGSAIVAVGAITGITSVLLTTLYGQTRIFFAMSRDGLIPSKLCEVHKVFGTPHIITWITGFLVALTGSLFPIDEIVEMCNIGTYFAFVATSVGVLVLRRIHPDLNRPFKCPAVWLVAPIAIFMCGYLATELPAITWWRFGIWSLIGIVIYLFYGMKHSVLQKPPVSGGPSAQS
ncbi:MAG TPA: amino acid permease [Selenomonadales bacterium]|nr:amino acid permease [Selenomonadales bacterium]